MGWKNVKEHYKIKHIVQVDMSSGDIKIGSPYIPDIIVITKEGKFIKRYTDGYSINEDLVRYQKEMDGDISRLVELINSPDSFQSALPVYYYDYENMVVVEDFCEEYGWPNCTNKGYLMYDNGFYKDKKLCIQTTIDNLKYRKEDCQQRINDLGVKREELLNRMIRAEQKTMDLEIELGRMIT